MQPLGGSEVAELPSLPVHVCVSRCVENQTLCVCVCGPVCVCASIDPPLLSYNEVELQLHYELLCHWLEVI